MVEVYRTNRAYFDEDPLIVITSGLKENLIFGEYFIFLNNQTETGYWKRLQGYPLENKTPIFELTEEYVRQDITQMALEKLYMHQSERFLRLNNVWYVEKRYELTSGTSDLTEVTRLILRNKYRGILKRIMEASYSKEIKEYLGRALALKSFEEHDF
jgi:hypothetical protein